MAATLTLEREKAWLQNSSQDESGLRERALQWQRDFGEISQLNSLCYLVVIIIHIGFLKKKKNGLGTNLCPVRVLSRYYIQVQYQEPGTF